MAHSFQLCGRSFRSGSLLFTDGAFRLTLRHKWPTLEATTADLAGAVWYNPNRSPFATWLVTPSAIDNRPTMFLNPESPKGTPFDLWMRDVTLVPQDWLMRTVPATSRTLWSFPWCLKCQDLDRPGPVGLRMYLRSEPSEVRAAIASLGLELPKFSTRGYD